MTGGETEVLFQSSRLVQILGWGIFISNILLLIGHVITILRVSSLKENLKTIENSFVATLGQQNETNKSIDKNLEKLTDIMLAIKQSIVIHDTKFEDFKAQYISMKKGD